MTDLTLVDGLTLASAVAIIAFLWGLHRDVRSLSERVAKLEGAMGVLTTNMQMLTQVLIEKRDKSAA